MADKPTPKNRWPPGLGLLLPINPAWLAAADLDPKSPPSNRAWQPSSNPLQERVREGLFDGYFFGGSLSGSREPAFSTKKLKCMTSSGRECGLRLEGFPQADVQLFASSLVNHIVSPGSRWPLQIARRVWEILDHVALSAQSRRQSLPGSSLQWHASGQTQQMSIRRLGSICRGLFRSIRKQFARRSVVQAKGHLMVALSVMFIFSTKLEL